MQTFDNRSLYKVRRCLLSSLPSSSNCRAASTLLLLLGALVVSTEAAPRPSSYSAASSLLSSLFRRSVPSDQPFVLALDYDSPTPSPEEGPPLSANALRDPAYLPAQIGGIVGAYAVSLIVVSIGLLALSKRRRNRLEAADELEVDENGEVKLPSFDTELPYPTYPDGQESQDSFPYPVQTPRSPRNFSYPSLASPTRSEPPQYFVPSPTSTVGAPGVDFSVDQDVVANDRRMAQQQLEDMYRYVMEQEAAKEAGITLDAPVIPRAATKNQSPQEQQAQQAGWQPQIPPTNASSTTLTKKEKKAKPAGLNLAANGEKHQSRTSSLFSALRSPRKKKHMQGMEISSPIMTPMSGTFPRGPEGEEMSAIPPRHYAPAAPPPVPLGSSSALILNMPPAGRRAAPIMPPTPEMSPNSTLSIDERIGAQFASAAPAGSSSNHMPQQYHSRNISTATSEIDPVSAVSERSTTPLVGLPSSPKPNMTRFPSGISGAPSLPSSPKPGATFQRAPAPSAVRTGGSLPLRAYERPLASPSATSHTTKQTTFERTGPLSPSGQRTPFTGMAVPYTPYQPFSPVIPMTPSLVTKADRKRIKRLEPKTPTLEMVRSSDDVW